jgi:proline iminopeptidase
MQVQVGDFKMFVDIDGAKLRPDGGAMREVPTVVLLHGGPGFDHSNFKPDFSPVAEYAQVVYFDHRGNGRSEKSDVSRWTLAQWGDDVRALCDALGIVKPVVLGVSFGGMVAMSYATRHPEHPAKLVLCSTAARIRQDRALEMFEKLGGEHARTVARRFFEDPTPERTEEFKQVCFPLYTREPMQPEFQSRSVQRMSVTKHFFEGEIKTYDLIAALAKVKCPTLVTAGDRDPITPIGDSEDIAAALPAKLVQFERFADCGHGVHRDDPQRFFRLLREFVTA